MEGRGWLPASLEDCNRAKALRVRERIAADVSPPRRGGAPVHHLSTLHRHSVHLSGCEPGTGRGRAVAEALFDLRLQRELEEAGPLDWSWSRRGRGLHALKSRGPGEGLLDAVSVCLWGVSDSGMALRTALHDTMMRNSPIDLRLSRVSMEHWRKAVKVVSPTAGAVESVDHPYQRVHLCVLANIIRRPIVVLGGSTEGAEAGSGPQGIYVPWLWEGPQCHPYPVVIGSLSPWRHFAPLVTAGSAQDDADGVLLPLVWGSQQGLRDLPLHLPSDLGEGARLSCLRPYLQLHTLSLGQHSVYAARLKGHNLPEPLSLVEDYLSLANHVSGQVTQEVRERGRDEHSVGLPQLACPSSSSSSSTALSITAHKCVTEHCRYFSSQLTWPLCHSCHDNRLQHQHQLQPRLQVRSSPPEGRDLGGSVGPLCRDTPPRVWLASGPSPTPSLDADPAPLGQGSREGGAKGSDFLCGRCQLCERETRTFNGLCFRCLQSQTGPPAGAPADPDPPARTRASPDREGPPEGRRCLTADCVYFGTAGQAGYCTLCYCTQKQTPTLTLPPAPPPSSSSSSSALRVSSSLRDLPRCSEPDCDMLGNPAFSGLCERCFLSRHRGPPESQASDTTPASQGNDWVSRTHRKPTSEPDPPSAGTEQAIAARAGSRQSPSGSRGNAQALPQLSRPRPCRTKDCTNFGNSRCEGFCNSCYRSHI